MENEDILAKAAKEKDSVMRAAMVIWFNTAKYAAISFRTLKPFNPILGETYEYSWKDFKLLVEQVSHHPPISAIHVYGKEYEYWDNSEMKSKFWGKSLEFTPLGKAYFVFGDQHYVCTKPNTIANNIIFGTLFLDWGGTTECICPQTGVKADLKHFSKGIFTRTLGKVEGHAYDSDGNKILRIEGNWTTKITIMNIESGEETVIWELQKQKILKIITHSQNFR